LRAACVVAVASVLLAGAICATAGEAQALAAPADGKREGGETTRPVAGQIAKFLAGGAIGLAAHEGGHLLFDGVFGVEPIIRPVHFGPFPFFAISHRAGLPPRQEFTIASAGFWVQHASSEVILSRFPRLKDRDPHARVLEGWLAFNVVSSVAYGVAALAKAGPVERDTRAMADSARMSERWAAALVLAPAVLDAWRYFHPESRWAVWASRGMKIGGVLLVLR
jgi:hypothetical protein